MKTNAFVHFALALGSIAVASGTAAQPVPPVSPAPASRYEYDANGNLTRRLQLLDGSGSGYSTRHQYDLLNRPHTSIDARGGAVLRSYSGRDDLSTVTDPVLALTRYERDGLGQVIRLTSADSGVTTRTHDAAGRLSSSTDARGVISSFSYDALNRLTRAEHSGGAAIAQVFTWNYDEAAAGATGIGRLTSISGPATYAQLRYDGQARLQQVLQRSVVSTMATGVPPFGPVVLDHGVGYEYEPGGQVARITLPSGRVVSYTFGSGLIQAISVAANAGATPRALISLVRWEPFGGAAGWTWQLDAGTQTHDVIRDVQGRAVRYTLGPYLRDLAYDAADRIVSATHYARSTGLPQTALDQRFGYDELGRITSVIAGARTIGVGYDANGNRNSLSIDASSGLYSIQANSNRMLAAPLPARSFTHDASGNRTAAASASLFHDAAGRLSAFFSGSQQGQYIHDAFGRRAIKASVTPSSGQFGAPLVRRTVFVYDQGDRLLGEYDGATGAPLREFVWLRDTPVAMFSPNPGAPTGEPVVHLIHTDHLDTPRVVTDRSGVVLWRWMVEPWGNAAPDNGSGGTSTLAFNLRMPGQYLDSESGLFYNFHRYYEPGTGRYTQSDPIGLGGGVNPYGYVENNPMSGVDPEGLIGLGGRSGGPGSGPGVGTGMWPIRPQPRPVDPTEPGGRQYTPAPQLPPSTISTLCQIAPIACATIVVSQTISATCQPSEADCRKEWLEAENICFEWIQELKSPRTTARRRKVLMELTGGSMGACKMGQVSQACGGNKVQW